MKIGITFQITFWVALLVFLSSIGISTTVLLHEKQTLTEARDQRGNLLVNNLIIITKNAIPSDNFLTIITYCHSLVTDETDVKQAMVIDTNRTIIAHNNPSMMGIECTSDRCTEILEEEKFSIASIEYQNERFIEYSMPLFMGEKRIGSAGITMSNKPVTARLTHLAVQIAAVSFILLVAGIIITILVTHFLIVKPIKALSEGIQTSSSGDFNRRITVKSKNEIGSASTLFNRMNKALYKQKNDLFTLYNTVQTLDVNRELDSLLSQSLSIVHDFITPNQCILSLVENNNLIIKQVSGFTPDNGLHSAILTLPNEVFTKTFQKKTAHKFVASSLAETFNDLHIALENPADEVLISPLVYGKKSKGLYILIGKKNDVAFTETDGKFLDIIAFATAMSLFNIELIKKASRKKSTEPDSVIAELTRKVLMPQRPFKMKGIEICSYYRPAGDTYGNWHGFIEDKDNNRLSVFIGDASGQGTHAALAASTASSFIKTMNMLKKQQDMLALIVDKMPDIPIDKRDIPLSMKPSYLLTLLNRIMFSNVYGRQTMTFFASTFDLVNKKVYFANAGHEIPVLIKKKDSLPASLTSSGARLGDGIDAHYNEHTLDLDPGDVIVWYTVGITQCKNQNKESYGNMRFLKKIRDMSASSAHELCKSIIEDIHSFRSNIPLIDDLTLVTGRIL